MKFLKRNTKRIVAAFLCLVLVCADLLIPSSTAQAEESRTVGRYVDIDATESTSTSLFKEYGYRLSMDTMNEATMYVMNVPEDLEGTATISGDSSKIRRKQSGTSTLGFRLIHYRAEEDVSQVIYPLDGGWCNYSTSNISFMKAVGSIEVKAGDKLYFAVEKQSSGGSTSTNLNLSLNMLMVNISFLYLI